MASGWPNPLKVLWRCLSRAVHCFFCGDMEAELEDFEMQIIQGARENLQQSNPAAYQALLRWQEREEARKKAGASCAAHVPQCTCKQQKVWVEVGNSNYKVVYSVDR